MRQPANVSAPLRVLADVSRLLAQHNRAVIVTLAAVGGVLVAAQGYVGVQDPTLFAAAGRKLLSSKALDVYADPLVQVGPLHLLIFGVIGLISDGLGLSLIVPLALVVHLAFIPFLAFTFRRVAEFQSVRITERTVLLCFLTLILGLGWSATVFGQFSDAFIPLLWMNAAIEGRKNRPMIVGLLLAVGVGLKAWGILGLPIVLMLPPIRPRVEAIAVMAGLTGLLYGPFLLFGEVRTFEFEWLIAPGSPWTWLYGTATQVSWIVRILEGVIVVAVGGAIVMVGRHSKAVVWAGPLAIAGARLVMDPEYWPWYLLAAATPALVGALYLIGEGGKTAARWVLVLLAAAISLLPEGQWLGVPVLAVALGGVLLDRPPQSYTRATSSGS